MWSHSAAFSMKEKEDSESESQSDEEDTIKRPHAGTLENVHYILAGIGVTDENDLFPAFGRHAESITLGKKTVVNTSPHLF